MGPRRSIPWMMRRGLPHARCRALLVPIGAVAVPMPCGHVGLFTSAHAAVRAATGRCRSVACRHTFGGGMSTSGRAWSSSTHDAPAARGQREGNAPAASERRHAQLVARGDALYVPYTPRSPSVAYALPHVPSGAARSISCPVAGCVARQQHDGTQSVNAVPTTKVRIDNCTCK